MIKKCYFTSWRITSISIDLVVLTVCVSRYEGGILLTAIYRAFHLTCIVFLKSRKVTTWSFGYLLDVEHNNIGAHISPSTKRVIYNDYDSKWLKSWKSDQDGGPGRSFSIDAFDVSFRCLMMQSCFGKIVASIVPRKILSIIQIHVFLAICKILQLVYYSIVGR